MSESLNQTDTNSQGRSGPQPGLYKSIKRSIFINNSLLIFVIIIFSLYVLVDKMFPKPILVFDQYGRAVGEIRWYEPGNRSDGEVLLVASRFIKNWLKLNAESVVEDKAIALSLMCEGLYDEKAAELVAVNPKTGMNWFDTVREAKNYSYVHVYGDDQSEEDLNRIPKVTDRKDDIVTVLLSGDIVIGYDKPERSPFAVEIKVRIVPRTLEQLDGACIEEFKDV